MRFVTNFDAKMRHAYSAGIARINQESGESGLFIKDVALYAFTKEPTPIPGMHALWCLNDELPENMHLLWNMVDRADPWRRMTCL